MKYVPLSRSSEFRRAVIVSGAIHLILVAFIVFCGTLANSQSGTVQGRIDTRIQEACVKLDTEEQTSYTVPEQKQIEITPVPPSQQEVTQVAQLPTVSRVPGLLPPGFIEIMKRSQSVTNQPTSVGPAEVVKPAGSTTIADTPPLHGAMKPGQSVVYILDCSGSMGEFGKLDMARSALMATLRRQPETLHFQVIPYNSNARLLLPGAWSTISGNLALTENRLARLEATGRSNHAEALRVAVTLRPEAIVWLTDADDLSAAKLKPIISGAGKPIPIYMSTVSARAVGTPQELR